MVLTACFAQGNCNSDPNQRSVTVMITDGCPECEADHVDIQALTFQKVSSSQALACSELSHMLHDAHVQQHPTACYDADASLTGSSASLHALMIR